MYKKILAAVLAAIMMITAVPVAFGEPMEVQASTTLTKYNDGGGIVFTDTDMDTINTLENLTVTVVFKLNDTSTAKAQALFTLVNDAKTEYVTFWYSPSSAESTGKGVGGYAYSGSAAGLRWAHANFRISDTNWHSVTFGLNSSNSNFVFSIDDTDGAAYGASAHWNSGKLLPAGLAAADADNKYTSALAGKIAEGVTYSTINNVAAMSDLDGEIKSIMITGDAISSGTAGRTKSKVATDGISTAYTNKVAECEELDESDYTTDSWEAYTAKMTEVPTTVSYDWQKCNAIDVMDAAIALLVPTSKFTGNTLYLEGRIGVNFLFELADAHKADTTTVKFTCGDEDLGTAAYDATNVYTDEESGKTYHKFTCYVAAKDMTKEITATLMDGDTDVASGTKSIKGYVESMITDSAKYTEADLTLAKKMLNYGGYAQKNFVAGVADTDLANVNVKAEFDLTNVTVPVDNVATLGSEIEGITYVGSTLVLKDTTSIRHYFAVDEGYTLSCTNYDVEAKDNMYYVEVPNIDAANLGTKYAVTVSNGTATAGYNYSAYSYAYAVLNGGSDNENLQNTVKALYLYGEQAAGYSAN